MAVVLNKSYLSLQIGRMFQLTADVPVTWSTSNPNVRVSQNGMVYADRVDKLRPDGQAVITATAGDSSTATCNVTIVNWTANELQLKYVSSPSGTWLAKARDGTVYTRSGTAIYRLSDMHKMGDVANYSASEAFVDTPFGYFYRKLDNSIYRSADLATWELIFTPEGANDDKSSLVHAFAWKHDEATGKGYLFIGEYSMNADYGHKVYRITVNPNNTIVSEVIKEFYAYNEFLADNNKVPACNHIHAIIVDPYTGDIFLNVGDLSTVCGWYRSTDNGDTWNVFAKDGTQDCRSLSMWFTEEYIYWNVDSSSPQSVWRIHRDNMSDISKKELVAKLDNGSMWYHFWAIDDNGRDFVIMAQTAEGQIRDWLARVYGIWELENGLNAVQELCSLPSSTPNAYVALVQLVSAFQDNDGYCYFTARNLAEPLGLRKMELVRNTVDNKALVRDMYKHLRAKFTV